MLSGIWTPLLAVLFSEQFLTQKFIDIYIGASLEYEGISDPVLTVQFVSGEVTS